jgi:outer membrane receptor for ferrienterochelin and colicin
MRKVMSFIVLASLLEGFVCPAWADDTMQFFQEEAEVVSASLQPQPANQSPATVFVVSRQTIKDSGAQTIPDALRNVPGVQVFQTTTGQQEVGIRGLNRPLNNRVLVLLDGKSVLTGYFNTVTWESIPVTMDEIDHIEVVEGPASAVYGTDAVSGVINIITLKPEQLQGGQVSYTGGERHTQAGSLNYGRKQDNVAYRFGGGWRSTNRFDNANGLATEAGKFDGSVRYDFSDHHSLSFSGGANNYNTQTSLGSYGTDFDKGLSSYMRSDYSFHNTTARFYWNHLRSIPDGNPFLVDSLDTDSYDMQLQQAMSLWRDNNAVVGTNYHRNTARSSVLNNGDSIHQDLWSAFLEDKQVLASKWMLMASGRLDRHPLTPLQFSPRGSLVYTPTPANVFRASAGTAFRNPTLLENYFNGAFTLPNDPAVTGAPNPPYTAVLQRINGSTTLDPETIHEQDIAYEGRLNRLKTTVTGFHATYDQAITIGDSAVTGPFLPSPPFAPFTPLPPTLNIQNSFANVTNDPTHMWGMGLDTEYVVTPWLRLLGNYTYEYLHDDLQIVTHQTPRHQANAGFRTKNAGWTTQWMVNWVDSTDWPEPVAAYFLLNAHVGYAFTRVKGLEVGVSAFNLLNHDHYEMGPTTENAQIVKSSIVGTVSYQF